MDNGGTCSGPSGHKDKGKQAPNHAKVAVAFFPNVLQLRHEHKNIIVRTGTLALFGTIWPYWHKTLALDVLIILFGIHVPYMFL